MSDYRSEKAKVARNCTKSLRDVLLGYRVLLEDALKAEGLTLPQLRLLKAIEEQQGVSGAAIARTCQITPQTLQAMLTRAVREKWIVREVSERNHRVLTATLTSKGRSLLDRGLAMAADLEAKLWAGVSIDDLDQTNVVLARGVDNLRVEQGRRRTPQ